MNINDLFKSLNLTIRPVQQDYISAVYIGLGVKNKIALLGADTGVGKTVGYLLSALRIVEKNPNAKFVVATSTHALMNQIMSSDRAIIERLGELMGLNNVTFSRLMGKTNYIDPSKVRDVIQNYPDSLLDEMTILKKLEHWKGSLIEFEEEYGELPTGVKPEMVTYSLWDKVDSIKEKQATALQSRFIITTHAMVIIDHFCKGGVFDNKKNLFLIVDEADMFVDMLELWQHRRLNIREVINYLSENIGVLGTNGLSIISERIKKVAGDLHFLSGREAIEIYNDAIQELIKTGSLIKDKEIKESFMSSLFSWITSPAFQGNIGIGVSKIRREAALININPFVGRNVGEYITTWESVLMTSATLHVTNDPAKGMEWITKSLGLDDDAISIKDIFSPEIYGEMKLTIAGSKFPAIFKNPQEQIISGEWLSGVEEQVKKIDGPVVVLTASHNESREIGKRLIDVDKPVYVQKTGQPLSEVVHLFQSNPGVLISATASVGLSLRNSNGEQIFHDLVITRMKFAPPNQEAANGYHQYLKQQGINSSIQSILRKRYVIQLQKVIRTGKQAIGRGIRSEKDFVRVFIFDPRFPEPKDISSKYRALVNIIPVRFENAYRECNIIAPQEIIEDIVC
ncbi:helicase C-terminal domain-containing protein [Dickeya sp. NCPPB 3274]|uniref:helicase C-terminal domain-containing protein n=1 Tax=Dickeya sp. NCPPB 3274 TaxID=568766 RepID=UPI0003A46CD3|nr:helicase C-terminal domain-containing protein [Dickeya sp. NCPPB 3274]